MTQSPEDMVENLIAEDVRRRAVYDGKETCRVFFGGDPPKNLSADDDEGHFVTVLLDGKKAPGDFKSIVSGESVVQYFGPRETREVKGNYTVVWTDEFKEDQS